MSKMILVFGSNEAGIHGAGAALMARLRYGAVLGHSYGHVGNSFAIPTKDQSIASALPLDRIKQYVEGFLAYAAGHPELKFKVTCIGCGLAGFKNEDIAPMFRTATTNCLFDDLWHPILGDRHSYWGTY